MKIGFDLSGYDVYVVPSGFVLINPKDPMRYSNVVEAGAITFDESTKRIYCVQEDYDKLMKATEKWEPKTE